jgi:hypothetical protein
MTRPFAQQFLKSPAESTATAIVSSKFFQKFLVAVDDSHAALHARFGWESFAVLATALGWYGFVAW